MCTKIFIYVVALLLNILKCNVVVCKENATARLLTTTQLQLAYPESFQTVNTKIDNNHIIDFEAIETVNRNHLLSPYEFYIFSQSINLVKNERCKSDLNATLNGILKGEQWALAMYDAMVKTTVGLESSVLHQFGHFDQCVRVKHETALRTNDVFSSSHIIHGKYCLADVKINGVKIDAHISRTQKAINTVNVHWAMCLPSTCMASDFEIFMQYLLQRSQITVNEELCQQHQYQQQEQTSLFETNRITNGMFIYAAIVLFFVLMAVVSTLYHIYCIWLATYTTNNPQNGCENTEKQQRNGTMQIALLSFSIIENTKKIFQTSKDQLGLNSVNGIKALAMLFILVGHACTFIYGSPLYNDDYLNMQIRNPVNSFISNSLLFVDTFLLLSGFLFCRILLIELERRRGKINPLVLYIGRYIRLTPAYLAVIGFYMTWMPSVGSGPLWYYRIDREQQRCLASWWLNILYINNYINTDKLCMFQSWYLSVDSQLFFLAPIVIYMLYKSKKYGLYLTAFLVPLTSAIPFLVTFVNKLDPTLLVYKDEVTDLSRNSFYSGFYIKTHMRASAYVIGLLTGYLVHLIQGHKIKLPAWLVRLGWSIAILIGIPSMFLVTHFYTHEFTNWESTLFAGFHKIGWNFSMAWLVFAVTTGHGNCLNWLSHQIFAPLSRLTYCAYLANGFVELYYSSNVRVSSYKNTVIMITDICGHIFNTFFIAFIICLLFESPIHALERIILRQELSKHTNTLSESNTIQTPDESPTPSLSQSPSTSEEHVA